MYRSQDWYFPEPQPEYQPDPAYVPGAYQPEEYRQETYQGEAYEGETYEAEPDRADPYHSERWYMPAQTYEAEQWSVPEQPYEAYAPEGDPAYQPEPEAPAPTAPVAGGKGRATKKKTYTRRGVLAGAVGGGAAVAAARLLILEKPDVLAGFGGSVVDLSDHHGRLHNSVLDAPQTPQTQVVTQVVGGAGFPTISEPLLVSQLLRRFTFGATDAQFQAANQQGFRKTVDQLLAATPAQPPPFKAGETLATGNISLNDLQDWWITHMITTPTPFQERMTLFMASIFTSDYQKVGLDNPFLIWQNRTWRDMAMTDLRSILKRVSIDPAMLVYLDGNNSNGRGTPNQNYARELMELFSIGLVYKETDVTEGAKALSGWRVPKTGETSQVGIFDPTRHFTGAVSFLGRNQPMDVDGVIDAILAHPASAPFITGKFVTEFVTATPDQAYIDRLAANFRKSGFQIKTLVRDILLSPEFAAQANFRALVKSPVEFMVGAARTTGVDPALATPVIRNYARTLGHQPFDPPDVGGWPRNIAWLSPVSLMNRVNFVTDFVGAVKTLPPAGSAAVTRYLDGILSPGTNQTLAQAQTDASRWWTLIASPDAQLA
ncbi:MAG TPA: DUF1800 family protein [Candidatus Dormibacteraeota bacterium]